MGECGYKDHNGVFGGLSWCEKEVEEFLVDSGCTKTLVDVSGGGQKVIDAVKSMGQVQS